MLFPALWWTFACYVTQFSKFESEAVIVHICLLTWCTAIHLLRTVFKLIFTICSTYPPPPPPKKLLHLDGDRLLSVRCAWHSLFNFASKSLTKCRFRAPIFIFTVRSECKLVHLYSVPHTYGYLFRFVSASFAARHRIYNRSALVWTQSCVSAWCLFDTYVILTSEARIGGKGKEAIGDLSCAADQ
jgi:hypothetical protein